MNTPYYIRVLGFASIVTILICAGILFYTHWDNQRFVAGFSQVPQFAAAPEPVKQRVLISKEPSEQEAASVTIDSQLLERHRVAPEMSDAEIAEMFFEDTYLPESDTVIEDLSLSTVEFPETSPSVPVEGIEFAETKAAWQDYNAFLTSAPDYAYEQLAEGFRKMYGDHPEIDTLVAVIRKANAGPITVDDAIDMATATLRIMPPDQTETIEMLSAQLEMFQTLKELQPHGEDVKVMFNIKVGE